MKLRLAGLASLDPLAVPLPAGTEVTTRVDRTVGSRRVPQGAVGRVKAHRSDGHLDVTLVGIGVVRFAREEVVPRKVGQARFAQRRHDAWAALRGCAIVETIVGSRAWGLAEEGSDVDLRGVFASPLSWQLGLVEAPDTLVSTDGSETLWAVEKAVRQALRADPNTLETLFVDSARAVDPMGQWLLDARDAFVSVEIYGSFGRYALSQLKRLNQSTRLAEHRVTVLEWLCEDPIPSLDNVARRLAQLHPRAVPSEADALHQAKDYVKQLYRSMYDQGLLPHRDYASLVSFAQNNRTDFDLPRDLRPKNAYNLIRLISTAIGWLRSGTPAFEVKGELRDRLLSIKRGEVSLNEVVRMGEKLTPELEAARQNTVLPLRANVRAVDELLHRIGEEIARRWTLREPGPWGSEAPSAPVAEWEES